MLVEGAGEGFKARVSDVEFFSGNDGTFARYGFFGRELGGGVFGYAGEVAGVLFAGFALKGFGVAVLVDFGI